MNMLKKILSGVGLLAMVATAQAQFFPAPDHGQIFSSTVQIGSATSNMTSHALSRSFPVGRNGVGVSITVYGTVALTATNMAVCFQGSGDGVNWIDVPATANNVVTYVTPAGTSVTTTWTNLQTTPVVAHNNLANLHYLRPTWITNNNGTNLITISNAVWSIRN